MKIHMPCMTINSTLHLTKMPYCPIYCFSFQVEKIGCNTSTLVQLDDCDADSYRHDLTPLDFFSWITVRALVYENIPGTKDELIAFIEDFCQLITPGR